MDFLIGEEVSTEVTNLDGNNLNSGVKKNNFALPGVVFLSKAEREKLRKEEERKKEEEQKLRENENRNHKKMYLNSKYQNESSVRDKAKERRFGNESPKTKHKIESNLNVGDIEMTFNNNDNYDDGDSINKNKQLDPKEVDAIKNYYLGLNKEKKRIIRPSEKFKNFFNFGWDDKEDTSNDINPIYSNKIQPKLLFGRGFMAGVDPKEQKRDAKKYERLLELERHQNNIHDEFNNNRNNNDPNREKERRIKSRSSSSSKGKRKRSRSRSRDHSHDKVHDKKREREDMYNLHWSKKSLKEMTERDWRIFREDYDIHLKGGKAPHPIRNWEEGSLPEFILKAISNAGYTEPTPIQLQGIPIGLEKRDMIALAPTGSGKSAAFLIPLITYLNSLPPLDSVSSEQGPYAIILAPTRELALQIHEDFNKFAKYTKLRAACLVGGRSAEEQAAQLGAGTEIIIGTPGRIQDALDRQYTILNQCHYVILDEADKMISDGFEESLNFILDQIPEKNYDLTINTNANANDNNITLIQEANPIRNKDRITMMFSATMTPTLEKLARKYLRAPAYISIGEPGVGKKEIEQRCEFVTENQKKERLKGILNKFKPPIIVFVNHKRAADVLCKSLEKTGFKVTSLHSGKNQESREKALNGFKKGKYDVLICTSLAARGIDVEGITLVVNFDCPTTIGDYTHRIGRTARAGMKGTAITFLTNSDEAVFYDLKEYLEKNEQKVPFELSNHPASRNKPKPYSKGDKDAKFHNRKKKTSSLYRLG
jgi:ATP-dependent RNA helicase DDX23/PRP28